MAKSDSQRQNHLAAVTSLNVNGAIVTALLLAIAVSLFLGWRALFSPPAQESASAPVQSVEPAMPTLTVNRDRQRKGAPIVVNPELIGKENPF